MDCRHCGHVYGNYGRGLCYSCYRKPEVKVQYPPMPHRDRVRKDQHPNDYEPTEEELDAVIAEQLANLPPWWQTDVRRQVKLEGPARWRAPYVCVTFRRVVRKRTA